jgi:hypothetical protein
MKRLIALLSLIAVLGFAADEGKKKEEKKKQVPLMKVVRLEGASPTREWREVKVLFTETIEAEVSSGGCMVSDVLVDIKSGNRNLEMVVKNHQEEVEWSFEERDGVVAVKFCNQGKQDLKQDFELSFLYEPREATKQEPSHAREDGEKEP